MKEIEDNINTYTDIPPHVDSNRLNTDINNLKTLNGSDISEDRNQN